MTMYPPPAGPDWKSWANALLSTFYQQTANRVPTDPRPVQLAFRMTGDKPTKDGLLMWNPTTGKPCYSKAGAWVDLP